MTSPRVRDGFRLVEIYIQIPPREIGFIKSIFESYESVGIIRTIDPDEGTIVVMTPADFHAEASRILESMRDQVPWRPVSPPGNFSGDWLLREIHETNG